MKHLIFLLLVLLPVWAASQSNEVGLEKLKAPTSPASVIIGIQPSEISRPKSVKDLELAIYNNFYTNNSFALPTDYALEVMPYWILNQKNIDERNYLKNVGWRSGWSNLSVSIATSTSYKLADTVNSNAIGVGARTILYRSKLEGKAKKLVNEIYLNRVIESLNIVVSTYLDQAELQGIDMNNFTAVKDFILTSVIEDATLKFQNQEDYFGIVSENDLRNNLETQFDLLEKDSTSLTTVENWEAKLNEIRKPLKAQYSVDSIETHLTDYLTNRKGFQLEMAGAVSINFPTNEFNYSRSPQWGVWLTGTYQGNEKAVLQYIGMARFIRNDLEFYRQFQVNDTVNSSNSLDLGGKLVLFPGRKFTTDAEAIARYQNSTVEKSLKNSDMETENVTAWHYRWVLNINYQIKDNLVLTYSFGKDFDPLLKVNGNIISSLGISFGFGNPKL